MLEIVQRHLTSSVAKNGELTRRDETPRFDSCLENRR